MYIVIGTCFVAEAGLDLVSEKVHILIGVMLAERRTRMGVLVDRTLGGGGVKVSEVESSGVR